MPTLVGGNTDAPASMIADRCSDFILARIQPENRGLQ